MRPLFARNEQCAATAVAIVLVFAASAWSDPPTRLGGGISPVPSEADNSAGGFTVSWQDAFAADEAEIVPTPLPVIDDSTQGKVEIPPKMNHGELILPPSPAINAANRSTRSNASHHGHGWVDEYQVRIEPDQPERWWVSENEDSQALSAQPWWDAAIRQPISTTTEPLQVDIATVTAGALQYSSFVRVVSANPAIQETELTTQRAAFDWLAFLETTYDDVNEPVGNTLTTGTNADRYKNQSWGLDTGVRRRNQHGGEVELFQRLGREEDNSTFLSPNPQRATRLELQYTQPLLRGAGSAYNQSMIVLAQIELERSSDTVANHLQDHLVKVTEAYWELYRARAEFLQRRKLLASARSILANLEERREVDAIERQVFRARTAVANRESEILRAETSIRNWQSRLRLLVNDPELVHAGDREFMPVDSPLLWEVPLSKADSLHTALLNRPDISQAIREARAASVKLGFARKDILPKLDLVASSYTAGLADASEGGKAFGNQFSDGRPAYSVGLNFEVPIGNRAATAQAKRRQHELDQAMSRFSLTVEEALTSVEIAVREVETSYREMVAKHQAMSAAQREADYLSDRWQVLPSVNDSAAQLLENLLDAQERVADEEQAMVGAQINYVTTMIKLKAEMGTLLRVGGT